MTLSKRILGGFALALLATVPVLAKVVTSAERPGNFTWTGTSLIPLTSGGADSIAFNGAGRFVISYSAECETEGLWVSIQILLDGSVLSPTADNGDAFCSDHDNNDVLDGWTTASYTVATPKLSSGVHTVQIQGNVRGAGGKGWLGDSSLVIQK